MKTLAASIYKVFSNLKIKKALAIMQEPFCDDWIRTSGIPAPKAGGLPLADVAIFIYQ